MTKGLVASVTEAGMFSAIQASEFCFRTLASRVVMFSRVARKRSDDLSTLI